MQVEINAKFAQANTTLQADNVTIMFSPPLDEDYWQFRVKLAEDQAILGFPKFGTIAIGFAQEENYNTNLPSRCDTMQIFNHIKHNKKYEQISDEDCIEAIRLVQEAAKSLE